MKALRAMDPSQTHAFIHIFNRCFSVLVLDLRCVSNQPLIVQLHGSRAVSVR